MKQDLNVTINPDAQEAESRKYYAWKILRLESGKYALFSPDYLLVGIFELPLPEKHPLGQCVFHSPPPESTPNDYLLEELGLK